MNSLFRRRCRCLARPVFLLAVIVSLCGISAAALADDHWEFPVRFSEAVHSKPFTGRVYVILTQRDREPRLGPSWFTPEKFVSKEVVNWPPGETLVISDTDSDGLLSYPEPLEKLDLRGYRAQAVVRFNLWERTIGTGPGNGFSQVIAVKQAGRQTELEVNATVSERAFEETPFTKLLKVQSKLLSDFHRHDVDQKAAVILPESYASQPERRYPVIFEVPGFGGDHFHGITPRPLAELAQDGVEFIRVMLDPSCPLGHHVFADSENNGPRGRCLVEEFIPELDRRFRTIAKPSARFVTGHSSGGWSSLWIQVTYPEHFGGVWSTAPDPVDFRDFQRINLYQPGENMYRDAAGEPRPLARIGGQVRLWYRGFSEMEWVLGPGGQLHSFEAVFSPRGADGKPQLIWDRRSGEVFTNVTKHWEKYDIRLVLERNWPELEPKLRGKLHVFMGEQDTFYLEGATRLLKQQLEQLQSDAVVEMIPDRDHFNLMTPELETRIRVQMGQAFLKSVR